MTILELAAWCVLVLLFVLDIAATLGFLGCPLWHRWTDWNEYRVIERTAHFYVNGWTGVKTDNGVSERTEFWQSRTCAKCGRSQRARVA